MPLKDEADRENDVSAASTVAPETKAPTVIRETRAKKAIATRELSPVVVTGRIRKETLQSVPVTVTAVTEDSPAAPALANETSQSAPATLSGKQPDAIPESQTRANSSSAKRERNFEEIVVTAARHSAADAKLAKQSREADAERWLEYIRDLRVQGKNFSANREWKHFQKAYPNFSVDEADVVHGKH
jgi:hypothetical protein